MNHILRGLAANENLPSELVDRLIAGVGADSDAVVAENLADRMDLSHNQALALLTRTPEVAVQLAYLGRLTAADIDHVTQPDVALALLDMGLGHPQWARHFAADPLAGHREKLASCPGLPSDVVETLAADPDVGVVAELALWAGPGTAAELAAHPHAEVRRAVAANEATPAHVLTGPADG